jgi:hypothetical protein
MIKPPSHSRFGQTNPIVTEEGVETFGVLKPYYFLDRNNLNEDDILRTKPITAEFAGKLDLLAEKIYGSIDLDWVFVLFNNVENPLKRYPEVGDIVEYPNPEIVLPLV